MAKNYAISADSLQENTFVLVRGKLGFSRVTSLIEGQELATSDAKRTIKGWLPVGKPHTSASLNHAEVLFRDSANPTREEQYVQERRFTYGDHPERGLAYSIASKSNQLPVIAARNADGKYEQIIPSGELASGLDVTFVLRVYKPQNQANRGIALEQILVNEPVRFYTPGGQTLDALADRGFVFATPPVPQQAQAGSAAAAGQPGATALPANTQYTGGYAMPTPEVAAAAPAPVPAVPAPAPAAPAAMDETPEQQLARLMAENEKLRSAQAAQVPAPAGVTNSQGGSAVGFDPNDPWSQNAAEGITFGN